MNDWANVAFWLTNKNWYKYILRDRKIERNMECRNGKCQSSSHWDADVSISRQAVATWYSALLFFSLTLLFDLPKKKYTKKEKRNRKKYIENYRQLGIQNAEFKY